MARPACVCMNHQLSAAYGALCVGDAVDEWIKVVFYFIFFTLRSQREGAALWNPRSSRFITIH